MDSNSNEIYLDNNATTRPIPEAVAAVSEILSFEYGNPSSPHQRGAGARAALERAREQVASLVGALADQILFTSGGTESNNLALNGVPENGPRRLVTIETEHSSVLKKACELERLGVEVEYIPVDRAGRADPEDVRIALEKSAGLVSVHWANNETGVMQPVEEIGEICRARKTPFHVDAAQAVGKIPISFNEMPIDILTFSSHKLHGPKGVGALCFKNIRHVSPVAFGGDQEMAVRPGTENLPGIAGFGAAAEVRKRDFRDICRHLEEMRDAFEREILGRFSRFEVNGDPLNRSCNTSNIRFSGVDGMALVAQLDREGIICSQTSACSSMRPEPSYVLTAMGLSEREAFSSVRFSFSVLNTEEEAEVAADKVAECCERLLAVGKAEAF